MATNPLIPLMSEVPKTDLFGSFLRGVDYKDSREDRARAKELQPMEDRLNKLKMDAAEQNLETGAIDQEVVKDQRQLQQVLQGYDHATNLLQIQDPIERARVHAEFERQMGIDDGEPDDLSDQALRDKAIALQSIAQRAQASIKGPTLGFTKGPTVKDSQNNLFTVSTKTNPQTGAVENIMKPVNPNGPQQPVGAVQPVNQSGLTSDEVIAQGVEENRQKKVVNEAVERGSAAVDSARQIRSSISTLNEVDALLAGESGEVPRTGPVWSRLPSFTSAAVQLDQLQGRMGLDVVAGGSFGALSESELKFALDVALPTNLEAKEMREWVKRKIAAQSMLANELELAGQFLLSGGTTAEYVQQMRSDARRFDREGIDPKVWAAMTDEERELFRK